MVWNRVPSAHLMIIGSNPPEAVTSLAKAGVEVVGYVPEVEPYYELARMSVNPLRYGAGVKGKIVASLRSGVPVVTTSIGNEGIGLRDGIDGFISDSPEGLAERIIALYEDDSLCARLADAGRSVVRRRFSLIRARKVLLEILGMDACVVCGAHVRMPQERETQSWYERPGCRSCGSSNLALMVAQVVLEPFRKYGISDLHTLRVRIRQLGLKDFGLLPSPVAQQSRAGSVALVHRGATPSQAAELAIDGWSSGALEVSGEGSHGGYDLIVNSNGHLLDSCTPEEILGLANELNSGGRVVCATTDIAAIESAWRIHAARVAERGDVSVNVGQLIIHEFAPPDANPNVGVVEYYK